MTEAAAYVDMKQLFSGDMSLNTYPQLRDAALSNEGNTRQLEELVRELDAKSGAKAATKKGIALWILGHSQAAIEALELGHPEEELASVFLGRAFLELEKPRQAMVKFGEGLQKHKDSAPLAWGTIQARLRSGDLELDPDKKEGNLLDRAEKRFGVTADSIFLRGLQKDLEGEYEQAKTFYEKALEKAPNHPEALFRLAFWHQTWGDTDAAIDLYERIRQLQPTYANALMNLGNLYEDIQKHDVAVECYREVLASIPNHPRAIQYLHDAQSSKSMFYDEDGERRADRQSAVLKIPVTDFELSVRSRNCLNKMNIRTLGDLIQMSEQELLAHKNFGETSLMEVKQMLAQKGLRLGQGKIEGGAMPVVPKPVEVSPEVLNQHIDSLDLSVRSRKCMERLGITTIGQLIGRTEAELLSAKNFGQTSLNEIKQRLEERGLRLKDAPY
jgi:DNA-directed RNA polymerase subunit alpha